MKNLIKRWKDGAEKHGGLDKAASQQLKDWTGGLTKVLEAVSSQKEDEEAAERVKQAIDLEAKLKAEEAAAHERAMQESRKSSFISMVMTYLREDQDLLDDVAIEGLEIIKRLEQKSTVDDMIEALSLLGDAQLISAIGTFATADFALIGDNSDDSVYSDMV